MLAHALLLLSALPASAPGERTSVLIMPIEAKTAVTKDLAEQITALVASEAAHHPNVDVITVKVAVLDGVIQDDPLLCRVSASGLEEGEPVTQDRVVFQSTR